MGVIRFGRAVQTALFFYVPFFPLMRYPFLPLTADDCMRMVGYQIAVSHQAIRSCGHLYVRLL